MTQGTRISSVSALLVAISFSSLAFGQVDPVPAPKKIKEIKPAYPPESLKAGDEGVVLIELSLNASGIVEEARILWSGCKRLDEAALTAVRRWRYEQVQLNGKAVPFKVMTEVPFRMPTAFRSRVGQPGACRWKEAPKPTM